MAALTRHSVLRYTQMYLPGKAMAAARTATTLHQAFRYKIKAVPSSPVSLVSRLTSAQVSSFHTSTARSILPALPQRVDGTANDPVSLPEPSPTHGSYHWTFERLVSAALIPLVVAPFAAGSLNPITDAILCGTLLIHSHVGFQAVVIDYVPKKRMPKIHSLFWWGLRFGTLAVGVGLYEFETSDVGITETIIKLWTV